MNVQIASPNARESERQIFSTINLGESERRLSLLSGFGLILLGMRLKGLKGLATVALGGYMIVRGASGFCWLYKLIGANSAVGQETAGVSVPHRQGVRVEERIQINRPVAEVYQFWRNFENMPRFMSNLKSVEVYDPLWSKWTVLGPANMPVSWDAEIINEVENEVIGWRSVENSTVANAGSVRFTPTPDGQGTLLVVKLEYLPPAGAAGALISKLFNRDPQQQVTDDLLNLKRLLESGEAQAATSAPLNGASG